MEKPYLTLVDPQHQSEHDQEFLPLPFYPWDERPPSLPLDHDECATAIHLAGGNLPHAAGLLKVSLVRLSRSVSGSPRLQRIREEANGLSVLKAEGKVLAALDAEEARRQEWAVNTILRSRMAMGSPFSPAPAASIQSDASLTVNREQKSFTFRWRTASDVLPDGD